ncbi:MAG: hypothetical protein M0Z87_01675, partial [Actinomycetota bacterium]|nr:hypothetical protein [Actinomycetota bacterium]
MYYAGQVGKRLPVPLFQSAESFGVFLCLLVVERWQVRRGGPTGLVLASMAVLWDIPRFTDEYFWLATPKLWNPVEVATIPIIAAGLVAVALLLHSDRKRRRAAVGGPVPTNEAVPGSSPPAPAGRQA